METTEIVLGSHKYRDCGIRNLSLCISIPYCLFFLFVFFHVYYINLSKTPCKVKSIGYKFMEKENLSDVIQMETMINRYFSDTDIL